MPIINNLMNLCQIIYNQSQIIYNPSTIIYNLIPIFKIIYNQILIINNPSLIIYNQILIFYKLWLIICNQNQIIVECGRPQYLQVPPTNPSLPLIILWFIHPIHFLTTIMFGLTSIVHWYASGRHSLWLPFEPSILRSRYPPLFVAIFFVPLIRAPSSLSISSIASNNIIPFYSLWSMEPFYMM